MRLRGRMASPSRGAIQGHIQTPNHVSNAIDSPTSTPRLSSGSKSDEQKRELDKKRIAIAEKSRVRRERTKGLAMGEKKGSVAEAKPPAEGDEGGASP